jgi:hypothetical protein
MFKKAWDISFTKENIQSAFRKPGVWPINGTEIIAKVTKPMPVFNPNYSASSKTPKIPLNLRALR